ncbi:MAG: hypothetical protein K2Y24_11950, partial [Pseudomonadaceae bacterium]|nr:hypothetical protein [Pseudomonadaceae bacterium]
MMLRVLLLSVLGLFSLPVFAATYTFSSGGFFNPHSPPPCSGGAWQARFGNVFTCTGRVILASGDDLRVSTVLGEGLGNIRVIASNGFALNNNVVGTAAKNISLESSVGSIDAIGTNTIQGAVVSASGTVNLSGTSVFSVTSGSGVISLNAGQVNGNVTGQGAITTNGTQVNGSLS